MESHCIPYSRLPETTGILRDYIDRFDRVATFYGSGSPFEPDSYRQLAESLRYVPETRAALARILLRQNRAFGASDQTLASLERFARPETVAVVSGQQVGLFSGPAFTLYKALTAVRLAHHLSNQGLPSVPVFWLATEDHDLEEVAATTLLDDDYQPVPLGDAGTRSAPQSSVGYVRLSESVAETLTRLESVLPDGASRKQLLGDLRAAYQPGAPWGEAFGRLMARLLGRFGVILIDALDPELHRLARPLFERAIGDAHALNARLQERSRALVDAGYHAQVHVGPESSLLFIEQDGNRRALRLTGTAEEFNVEAGSSISAEDVRHLADARPEAITPNALFRPLVQDALLPTIAYIAGPAELAYHAQSAVLYPAFGRQQPVIFPRASFTLVDPRTGRLLDKYEISVDDVWQGPAHLAERIAALSLSPGWQDRLERDEREIALVLERLQSEVRAIDPTLLDAVEHTRKSIAGQIEKLKGKITRSAFAGSEVLGRHQQALESFFLPGGHLQERSISGIYFLGRAGYGVLDQLLARIPTDSACHHVLPFRYALP
jgi:bacillithiol biosynthesis cysteine-adding enzyme BshC